MTRHRQGIFSASAVMAFMLLSLCLVVTAGIEPSALKVTASEVGDMMKDPYHNITESTSDRDEVPVVDSETDTINNPHVTHDNKTHEEEHHPEKATDGSSEPGAVSTSSYDRSEPGAVGSSTSSSDVSSHEAESLTTLGTNPESSNEASSSPPTKNGSSVESSTVVSATTAVPVYASTLVVQETDEGVMPPPVSALVSQHDTHDHPTIGKSASLNHTTQAAAILAGVLVLVALAGYVGLLSWRRLLEKRYGNREMLVNEDDDFRHFEL